MHFPLSFCKNAVINFWKAPEDRCYYRGDIFSLKFTKYRLAAGLRPDLGELKRSPRPHSRNTGGLLLRRGERRGGKGREAEGEGRGREGEGEGETCSKVLGGIDAPGVSAVYTEFWHPKIAISHWLAASPLQQCTHYSATLWYSTGKHFDFIGCTTTFIKLWLRLLKFDKYTLCRSWL